MIKCARRISSLPVSKKLVDADVVKIVLNRFGAEDASLKVLRIASVISVLLNKLTFNSTK